jgi:hypothetical protein
MAERRVDSGAEYRRTVGRRVKKAGDLLATLAPHKAKGSIAQEKVLVRNLGDSAIDVTGSSRFGIV